MKISFKQVFVALLSMIITLGVLFAGQQVYRSAMVESPLVSNLGAIAGVRQARIQGNTVTVSMQSHANLMNVYQTVELKATEFLGHAPQKVVIESHSDSVLEQLANNVAFVVAQGEATGQYVAMKNTIATMARSQHAAVNMQMDSHHLYLTFHHHTAVLYDVVSIALGGSSHA
ncbi:MAG: hypothetical protein C7B45_01990 [Sulfobacillus acidophilus]|uniref:Uncharacterized protein n=1 Tax=Sulfobacillus acidophilus TaxID=53633 RepID=A0A2T2WNK2_9FIRM|nr:MAG: hypothetical protein C7B45_01990 [Sulfobacillus acidophilus]